MSSSDTSRTVVSNPAIAAVCAMPAPIKPHPSTPTFLISILGLLRISSLSGISRRQVKAPGHQHQTRDLQNAPGKPHARRCARAFVADDARDRHPGEQSAEVRSIIDYSASEKTYAKIE